jgi:hypothetical protein
MARTKNTLPDKVDLNYLISFGFLSHLCSKNIIKDVLDKFDKNSQRICVFPATAVVYFNIAMSLWRDVPTDEVIRILVENINWVNQGVNQVPCPDKSTISKARNRLGSEVMREIAEQILMPIASLELQGSWYKGLRLMALDGSLFDLPDEKLNAEYFGYPSAARGEPAFPQARVLSLVETGTHVVTAAEIGPYRLSEQAMANKLIEAGKLDCSMLLLADRGFYGYGLWTKAVSTGASLLWRIKKNLQLPVEQRLSDGSYLSHVFDSRNRDECVPIKVRVIEYILKDKNKKDLSDNIGSEIYRLVTNIFDYNLAPAHELACLYHERWEIESLFGEFKRYLSHNSTVIRSKTPMLVEQEIWGLIIVHFAIRQIMAESALRKNLDPDILSLKKAINVIRRKLPQTAAFPPNESDNDE